MKCNTTFARSRLSCLLTIGISFLTLFHPLELVGQNKLAADSQLQTMKQHYQQWLAGRPASDLFVEFDPVPVALDKPKPRFSWILNLEGRGAQAIRLPDIGCIQQKNTRCG